jgi:adenylosuccinate synthase
MTTYEQLPIELKEYIEFIEAAVEVPIKVYLLDQTEKQTILNNNLTL